MKQFFKTKGLIHQTSCAHTPEQNGVSERKNRIILEMTRALLIESQVPKSFWPEAVATSVYLLNRLPTKALKFMTPLDCLSKSVSIPHPLTLDPRIFGCTTFVHIPKTNRNKLGPCAEKCVFVGYGIGQIGYRCYNPKTHQMFTTMNVDFLETKYFYNTQLSGQGENECIDTLSWLTQFPSSEEVTTENHHSTPSQSPSNTATQSAERSTTEESPSNVIPEYSSQRLKKSHNNRFLVIGTPIVAAGVFLCAFICYYIWKIRGKLNEGKARFNFMNSLKSSEGCLTDKDIGENVDIHVFDFSKILVATDNFSPSNKVGEGGFGSVYKGKLLNGQEIAVKRLSQSSGQGMQEFKNEVTLIAKLQHRNLVRLLGYCFRKEEKMLVYEYLPNKGLDSFIFDQEKASLLDWKKRLQIIQGIVRGLLYLHHDSRLKIIHRDLKASNVLLDTNLNPKISDFGMAKIFGGEEDEAKTRRVVGTYGYMSPEYAMEGLFSVKSDVFSFGILLLEMISGRKNNSYYKDNSVNLIGHVWDLWKQDKALMVVDSSLGDSYDAHEVLLCIHIGILCVQELASDRPTMTDVAFMLSNRETMLPPPNQPAFIFRQLKYGMDSKSASASGGDGSVFDDTITILHPR
ncbi:putative protein kinase RLK-Pelle-DLSV family [Helianthus annuus]|nr:putative protein kinase RLK-Pelle-DLSV family [Helianthus annuus]